MTTIRVNCVSKIVTSARQMLFALFTIVFAFGTRPVGRPPSILCSDHVFWSRYLSLLPPWVMQSQSGHTGTRRSSVALDGPISVPIPSPFLALFPPRFLVLQFAVLVEKFARLSSIPCSEERHTENKSLTTPGCRCKTTVYTEIHGKC